MQNCNLSASSLPPELWNAIVEMGASDHIPHVAYAEKSDGMFVYLSQQCYDWLETKMASLKPVLASGHYPSEDVVEWIECRTGDATTLTLQYIDAYEIDDYHIELELCLGRDFCGKKANLTASVRDNIAAIENHPVFKKVDLSTWIIPRLLRNCLEQVAKDFQESGKYRPAEWDYCLYGRRDK